MSAKATAGREGREGSAKDAKEFKFKMNSKIIFMAVPFASFASSSRLLRPVLN
jgi:hypothetical protein